jgi:hypothetical protein
MIYFQKNFGISFFFFYCFYEKIDYYILYFFDFCLLEIDKFQNQYGQFDEAHIKRNNVLGAYIHCHKMVPIGVIVLCKNSQYKIRRLSIVIIYCSGILSSFSLKTGAFRVHQHTLYASSV